MANKKKIYSAVFILVALICLLGFIWSFTVTGDIRRTQKTGDDSDTKKQVVTVKNLVLTETKEGEIFWELYAEKGSYDSKTGDVILTKATGNFYDKNNRVALSFASDVGTYSEKTKKIALEGHVLAVAHDGSSIRADRVDFQGKGDDIYASGNVIVTRNQDFVSTASRAKFNSELTLFEIMGDTQTNVYAKDKQDVQKLVN